MTEPDTTFRSQSTSGYVVVFVGMLLQNFLLFLLSVVIAAAFGTQAEVDAFRSALTPPLMLAAMFGGLVSPILMNLLSRRDDDDSLQTAALLAGLLAGFSFLLALIAFVFRAPILNVLHPGFDSHRAQLSSQLFAILVWMLPINTLIALTQSVLNSHLNFRRPAISGVIGPLLTIVMVYVLIPTQGIHGVAWGTLGGGVASILILLRPSMRLLPRLNRDKISAVGKVLIQAWPLAVGMIFFKLDPLVDQRFLSSRPDGEIAQWDYAYRVLMPFLMLSSGALSTVAFPRLLQAFQAGTANFRDEFAQVLKLLISLTLPALAVVSLFSTPLIRDLLERQQFTVHDTAAVANVLQVLGLMLLGLALGEICSKTLYAAGDVGTPNLIFAGLLIAGFLWKAMSVETGGVQSVAWIGSIVMLTYGVSLLVLICRRLNYLPNQELLWHLFVCILGTAAAVAIGGLSLLLISRFPQIPFPSIWGMTLGGAAYLVILALFGVVKQDFSGLKIRRSKVT